LVWGFVPHLYTDTRAGKHINPPEALVNSNYLANINARKKTKRKSCAIHQLKYVLFRWHKLPEKPSIIPKVNKFTKQHQKLKKSQLTINGGVHLRQLEDMQ